MRGKEAVDFGGDSGVERRVCIWDHTIWENARGVWGPGGRWEGRRYIWEFVGVRSVVILVCTEMPYRRQKRQFITNVHEKREFQSIHQLLHYVLDLGWDLSLNGVFSS